jgi:hypothetical protein
MPSVKTEQLTIALLKNNPWLVEDDKYLLLAIWKRQGLELTQAQKEIWFNDCSTPESVTRVRRKAIEQGLISQSLEAQNRRKSEAEAYRKKYSRQQSLI